jgi:hypothetical protein
MDTMIDALANQSQQSAVPQGYAEKAMASLMQLHTELMDEKERRVELYRRLMEREQSLAEAKSYTRLLEEKLAALGRLASPQPEETRHSEVRAEAEAPARVQATPPAVPPIRPILRAAPRATHPGPAEGRDSPLTRSPPPLPRQAVAVGMGRAPAARGVPDGWKTW